MVHRATWLLVALEGTLWGLAGTIVGTAHRDGGASTRRHRNRGLPEELTHLAGVRSPSDSWSLGPPFGAHLHPPEWRPRRCPAQPRPTRSRQEIGPGRRRGRCESGTRSPRTNRPLPPSTPRTSSAGAADALDQLIRQLTLYRDLIDRRMNEPRESRRALASSWINSQFIFLLNRNRRYQASDRDRGCRPVCAGASRSRSYRGRSARHQSGHEIDGVSRWVCAWRHLASRTRAAMSERWSLPSARARVWDAARRCARGAGRPTTSARVLLGDLSCGLAVERTEGNANYKQSTATVAGSRQSLSVDYLK